VAAAPAVEVEVLAGAFWEADPDGAWVADELALVVESVEGVLTSASLGSMVPHWFLMLVSHASWPCELWVLAAMQSEKALSQMNCGRVSEYALHSGRLRQSSRSGWSGCNPRERAQSRWSTCRRTPGWSVPGPVSPQFSKTEAETCDSEHTVSHLFSVGVLLQRVRQELY
jgi:hypothetical protein